jgi:hypothetical protein
MCVRISKAGQCAGKPADARSRDTGVPAKRTGEHLPELGPVAIGRPGSNQPRYNDAQV